MHRTDNQSIDPLMMTSVRCLYGEDILAVVGDGQGELQLRHVIGDLMPEHIVIELVSPMDI